MRLGGFCTSVFLAAVTLVALGVGGNAQAATIGNWEMSSRSWNNTHMTKIKASMQNAGHRVDADGSIASGLRSAAVYVLGEPIATPTAAELALLRQFIRDGGMAFVFGDTGIDIQTYNNLLGGIGSTIAFTSTTIGTSSALPDGQFTQGPSKITGNTLSVTSGTGTTGGTLIDTNYVRYERIGAGYVVVFGDRIDHNEVISDVNTNLLLNLVSAAIGPVVPVPSVSSAGLALMSLLLAAMGMSFAARRRRI